MFGLIRTVGFYSLLPAVVLGPYFYSTGKVNETVAQTYNQLFGETKEEDNSIQAIEASLTEPTQPVANGSNVAEIPVHLTLDQVLRFDVTSDWVVQNWPEVSGVTAQSHYEGLRVPLLTGVQVHDIAGALTYYFDQSRRVQRITLSGTTGDPRQLMALVQQRYGLQPQSTLETGVLIKKWNRTITSALRVQRANVIRRDTPHNQYSFYLELNNPNLRFSISPEFAAELQRGHSAKRW